MTDPDTSSTTSAPAVDVLAIVAAMQDQLDDLAAAVAAQQRALEELTARVAAGGL